MENTLCTLQVIQVCTLQQKKLKEKKNVLVFLNSSFNIFPPFKVGLFFYWLLKKEKENKCFIYNELH